MHTMIRKMSIWINKFHKTEYYVMFITVTGKYTNRIATKVEERTCNNDPVKCTAVSRCIILFRLWLVHFTIPCCNLSCRRRFRSVPVKSALPTHVNHAATEELNLDCFPWNPPLLVVIFTAFSPPISGSIFTDRCELIIKLALCLTT